MSNLTLHIFFHRTPEQRLLPHLQNFSSLMHNICHIMGNHQDCNLFFLIQFPDQLIKVQNRRRIESRDRLIENQQLIRRTERPRDQNTLFLTAGKLSETAFFQIADSQTIQICPRLFLFFHRIKRAAAAFSPGTRR